MAYRDGIVEFAVILQNLIQFQIVHPIVEKNQDRKHVGWTVYLGDAGHGLLNYGFDLTPVTENNIDYHLLSPHPIRGAKDGEEKEGCKLTSLIRDWRREVLESRLED